MAHITTSDALTFLRWHYKTPMVTPEGIFVVSEVVIGDNITRYRDDQDDNWYEEPMVFTITDHNTVDCTAIKQWLGY